jgi:sugar-phosphatase
VATFRWWAELRGLSSELVERIPFGRTSTDAAAQLAPQLDHLAEGRLLDARQEQDTVGVVALDGAAELLSSHHRLAVVTPCPHSLAEARLRAASLPIPRVSITPERWTRGKPDPEPYLLGAAALDVRPADCVVLEDAPAGVRVQFPLDSAMPKSPAFQHAQTGACKKYGK